MYLIQRYAKLLDKWFSFDGRYASKKQAEQQIPLLCIVGSCKPTDLRVAAAKK